MSIANELEKIIEYRNRIRTKLVELGIVASDAKLEAITTAIAAITDNGDVSIEVVEGDSYTIPSGYHRGGGTVRAISNEAGDAEKYKLQDNKPIVTPTKEPQEITADTGYYGLSKVSVGAIPANYQDTSDVTATSGDVLANKIIVDKDGNIITGTMIDNGAVMIELNSTIINYTIPKGYHNGSGTVKIILEEKTTTPTKETQTITPESGKVLSKVIVNPIPEDYVTTTDADAISGEILNGKTAYVKGSKIVGTMTNHGAAALELDGMEETEVIIPEGYHNGSGKITLTSSIEEALAAI